MIQKYVTETELECRAHRQASCYQWVNTTFGGADSSPRIRLRRFIEEAIELAQAGGLTEADVAHEVAAVYSRPIGVPQQEIGGVTLTLYAYAESVGMSVARCELDEVDRVNEKPVEHFQKRQREKIEEGRA